LAPSFDELSMDTKSLSNSMSKKKTS